MLRNCSEMASIIVGQNRQEWTISTELLSFHSGYFRSALKGGFAEATTRRVELLDGNPEAFELIVEWLHTHEVGARLPYSYGDYEGQGARLGKLLDTWMLAEYLQMPKLQNIIITSMSDQMTETNYIPVKEFNRVCEATGPGTPLYTWIGECTAWAWPVCDNFYEDCTDESAVQLLISLCDTLYSKRRITGKKCPINELCLVEEPKD
jgi:hypothetical protein